MGISEHYGIQFVKSNGVELLVDRVDVCEVAISANERCRWQSRVKYGGRSWTTNFE